MNRSIKTLLAFMLLAMVTSCTIDEDLDPTDQDARDKFVGTWLFTESDAARGMSYSVNVSLDNNNSSQVVLRNMGNFGNSYSAKGIVTSSTVYITSQEIYPGITIEGEGQLTGTDEMEWSYTITGGGGSDSYSATATR